MPGSILDSWLARWSARISPRLPTGELPMQSVNTPAGSVRVFDSGSSKHCVVFVPMGRT